MSVVFTGTIKSTLKRTLSAIVKDPDDGGARAIMPQIFDEEPMEDNFEDDLEIAGPGYATEKPEGQAISVGQVREGTLWRYIARTFAQQLSVTREAVEDNKYQQAFKYARFLKRAMRKTIDFDATGILIHGFDTSYPFADGVPLFSASHPLPNGDVFSNKMSVAMTPSVTALVVATSALMAFPGHDGLPEAVMPKKIHCPVGQWATWKEIVKSEYSPASGDFNKINVMNKSWGGTIDEVIPNPFWTNTTDDWAVGTDAEDGLKWKWKRKPDGDDWMDNSQQVFNWSLSCRYARGCSNPRSIYGNDG